MSSHNISEYVQHLSYLGIFFWFAFLEQLTPVPEEVSLVSLGYVAKHFSLNLPICGMVALVGLVCTDNLFFYLTLKSHNLVTRLLGKVNNRLVEQIKKKLQNDSIKTMIVMALLPKLRFLSPVLAASTGIAWKTFFFINSLATAFYVTVYMLAGIFFQRQLQIILHELQIWQHIIFIVLMISVTIFLILRIRKITKTV